MKKPNEILEDMASRLESVQYELGVIKEVIFKGKNEIVKETESLRRQFADMIWPGMKNEHPVAARKAFDDGYLEAMSKSALGTSTKLKALVEHLELEYVPEGDVRQKAHFKENKK